jgi:nitrate reductase NapD
MSFSGILVRALPSQVPALAPRLDALAGVRVHQTDPESGRLIVTLEAGSTDDEVAGLRRIQQVPGVVSADLVYHRIVDDSSGALAAAAAADAEPPQNPHRGETP